MELILELSDSSVLHSEWQIVSTDAVRLLASDVVSFDPCRVDGFLAPIDSEGQTLITADAQVIDCRINGLEPNREHQLRAVALKDVVAE